MDQKAIQDLIVSIAQSQNVNVQLALAIAAQESNFNPNVVRYEPSWRYLFHPSIYCKHMGITKNTEIILQSISWGVMQVMGSVLRELGYNGHLTQMIDPNLSISFGCKKLFKISKKFENELDIIATYNAGFPRKNDDGSYLNQSYVDGVTKRLLALRQ